MKASTGQSTSQDESSDSTGFAFTGIERIGLAPISYHPCEEVQDSIPIAINMIVTDSETSKRLGNSGGTTGRNDCISVHLTRVVATFGHNILRGRFLACFCLIDFPESLGDRVASSDQPFVRTPHHATAVLQLESVLLGG